MAIWQKPRLVNQSPGPASLQVLALGVHMGSKRPRVAQFEQIREKHIPALDYTWTLKVVTVNYSCIA